MGLIDPSPLSFALRITQKSRMKLNVCKDQELKQPELKSNPQNKTGIT